MPDEDRGVSDILKLKISTSVLSDVLDVLGHRSQTMGPEIRPIYLGSRLAARAVTVVCAPATVDSPRDYSSSMCSVIDQLASNVVPVVYAGGVHAATWGDLFCVAARKRGACGLVVDGCVRDVAEITNMAFPVFATGVQMAASGGRLRVVEQNCPITCGGVLVHSGDLIVGDDDGVVVIPQSVEKQAVSLALDKIKREAEIHEQLVGGATLKSQYYQSGS
jgi:regulator of RNase E activity RraA